MKRKYIWFGFGFRPRGCAVGNARARFGDRLFFQGGILLVLHRAGLHGIAARFFKDVAEDAAFGSRFGAAADERDGTMKRKNIGSAFDSFLREEGTYEDVSAAAIKRVLARQVSAAMEERCLSKAEMARRMRTSRAALDRLLDPEYEAVTLTTLRKAAQAVGREVRIELV